jgi:hypothetical protein
MMRRFFFGELQPRVNNDDFIFVFEKHHVSPYFFQAAERHKPNDRFV